MVWFERVTSPEYKERYRRLDPLRTASIRKADRCQSLKRQQDQALRYLLIAFWLHAPRKLKRAFLSHRTRKQDLITWALGQQSRKKIAPTWKKKKQPLTFNTLTMNCRFWHEFSTLCQNLWSQMLISEVCPSSHKIGFFHSPATAQQNNCKWVQRFKIPWIFFSKLSRMFVLVSFSFVTRTLGAIYWILDVTTKTVFDYLPAWFQNTWPNYSQCTFSLADSLKLKHTRMLLSNWTSNPWKFLKLETTVFLVYSQAVQTSRRWTFIQVRSTRWNSDVHVMWFKLWRFGRRKYHWLPVVLIQEEFESENSFII